MNPELAYHLQGIAMGFALGITAFFMSFGGIAIMRLFQDAAQN